MKRLKLLLVFILSLLLTGCIQEYDVTEEQSDAIAEYMAGMILKYDNDYQEALLPMEVVSEESSNDSNSPDNSSSNTENEKDAISSNNNGGQEVTDSNEIVDTVEIVDNSTLTQVIGVSGFTINYSDYKIVDTYPEDPVNEGIYLGYNKGFQYLVASFTVKNTLDNEKEINLIKSGTEYQLNVNGTKEYEPALTLLENDLRYLDMKIAGGKSENVILIFKVPSDITNEDIKLTITKDNKAVAIALR